MKKVMKRVGVLGLLLTGILLNTGCAVFKPEGRHSFVAVNHTNHYITDIYMVYYYSEYFQNKRPFDGVKYGEKVIGDPRLLDHDYLFGVFSVQAHQEAGRGDGRPDLIVLPRRAKFYWRVWTKVGEDEYSKEYYWAELDIPPYPGLPDDAVEIYENNLRMHIFPDNHVELELSISYWKALGYNINGSSVVSNYQGPKKLGWWKNCPCN